MEPNISHEGIPSACRKKLAAGLILFALVFGSTTITSCLSVQVDPKTATKKVEEVAPPFTLEDQDGKKITLQGMLAQGPVILVFFRGTW